MTKLSTVIAREAVPFAVIGFAVVPSVVLYNARNVLPAEFPVAESILFLGAVGAGFSLAISSVAFTLVKVFEVVRGR